MRDCASVRVCSAEQPPLPLSHRQIWGGWPLPSSAPAHLPARPPPLVPRHLCHAMQLQPQRQQPLRQGLRTVHTQPHTPTRPAHMTTQAHKHTSTQAHKHTSTQRQQPLRQGLRTVHTQPHTSTRPAHMTTQAHEHTSTHTSTHTTTHTYTHARRSAGSRHRAQGDPGRWGRWGWPAHHAGRAAHRVLPLGL